MSHHTPRTLWLPAWTTPCSVTGPIPEKGNYLSSAPWILHTLLPLENQRSHIRQRFVAVLPKSVFCLDTSLHILHTHLAKTSLRKSKRNFLTCCKRGQWNQTLHQCSTTWSFSIASDPYSNRELHTRVEVYVMYAVVVEEDPVGFWIIERVELWTVGETIVQNTTSKYLRIWLVDGFLIVCFFYPTFLPPHGRSTFISDSGFLCRYPSASINVNNVNSVPCACFFAIRWFSLKVTMFHFGKLDKRYRMSCFASDSRHLSCCSPDSVVIIVIPGGNGHATFFAQTSLSVLLMFRIVRCADTSGCWVLGADPTRLYCSNHPTRSYLVGWFPQCCLPRVCDKLQLSLLCIFQINVCSTWHFVFVSCWTGVFCQCNVL